MKKKPNHPSKEYNTTDKIFELQGKALEIAIDMNKYILTSNERLKALYSEADAVKEATYKMLDQRHREIKALLGLGDEDNFAVDATYGTLGHYYGKVSEPHPLVRIFEVGGSPEEDGGAPGGKLN